MFYPKINGKPPKGPKELKTVTCSVEHGLGQGEYGTEEGIRETAVSTVSEGMGSLATRGADGRDRICFGDRLDRLADVSGKPGEWRERAAHI